METQACREIIAMWYYGTENKECKERGLEPANDIEKQKARYKIYVKRCLSDKI